MDHPASSAALPPAAVVSTHRCRSCATCARSGRAVISGTKAPGRAANARGDPETALEHFRRAAAYQPRHVFYREQLGVQLRQMGRDREALEVFRRNVAEGVASDVSILNVRALERLSARPAPVPP